MTFKGHRPGPRLAPYVDRLWYFDDLAVCHDSERVLPQATFELIINLDEGPRKLFTNRERTQWQNYRGAWISGAQSKFIEIDVIRGSSMMGAHFKPGGAGAFLEFSAQELADRVEEIDRIWDRSSLRLREMLLAAGTIAEKFATMERFLEMKLKNPQPRWFGFALEQLAGKRATHRIGELPRQLGMSHKQFISLFRARTGLTPKRFGRIVRFQSVLAKIETKQKVEWASLAADCGYYDQAHLIRDFTVFSGMTPLLYLAERDEELNFVPIGER